MEEHIAHSWCGGNSRANMEKAGAVNEFCSSQRSLSTTPFVFNYLSPVILKDVFTSYVKQRKVF